MDDAKLDLQPSSILFVKSDAVLGTCTSKDIDNNNNMRYHARKTRAEFSVMLG